ncbi:NEW3 domain-containing protein [Cohnella rhizosphaerae]|uniref:NEW3 domain-containing protein n=1 Tax=Cohnella rhizosphaerae TaxID=1457232 RepID=A0A9X4KRT1_9BACL|nr:NEW3 domain-containing protein [Cohnella rhizosphaerae]MDG0809961.1 NEW3 domain-containing protein [Cohnella rhizosphaerae]
MTNGQTFKIKGKVTNQYASAITAGTLSLDTGGWTVVSSTGTSLTGLAAGASQNFEFQVTAGTGTNYAKRAIAANASFTVGGSSKTGSESTFVVLAEQVHGTIEPVSQAVFAGDTFDMLGDLRNYSVAARTGTYSLVAPSGWYVTSDGDGTYSLSGYTGGVHTNRKATRTFHVTVPDGTPAGSYTVTLRYSTDGGHRRVVDDGQGRELSRQRQLRASCGRPSEAGRLADQRQHGREPVDRREGRDPIRQARRHGLRNEYSPGMVHARSEQELCRGGVGEGDRREDPDLRRRGGRLVRLSGDQRLRRRDGLLLAEGQLQIQAQAERGPYEHPDSDLGRRDDDGLRRQRRLQARSRRQHAAEQLGRDGRERGRDRRPMGQIRLSDADDRRRDGGRRRQVAADRRDGLQQRHRAGVDRRQPGRQLHA